MSRVDPELSTLGEHTPICMLVSASVLLLMSFHDSDFDRLKLCALLT